jgi:hypothetical protein
VEAFAHGVNPAGEMRLACRLNQVFVRIPALAISRTDPAVIRLRNSGHL